MRWQFRSCAIVYTAATALTFLTPGVSAMTIVSQASAITGVTEVRFCGGPASPLACQSPYFPMSATVTVLSGGRLVRQVQSDSLGQFSIDVAPGVYDVQEWV